jgi:hypothetical protein
VGGGDRRLGPRRLAGQLPRGPTAGAPGGGRPLSHPAAHPRARLPRAPSTPASTPCVSGSRRGTSPMGGSPARGPGAHSITWGTASRRRRGRDGHSASRPRAGPGRPPSRRRAGEGHLGIDDGYLEPMGEHTCGGVEGHAMHTRITPQEHRAGLDWNGRLRAYGQQVSPWGLGSGCGVHGQRTLPTFC